MRKQIVAITFIMFMLFSIQVIGANVFQMPELNKPEGLYIQGDYILISQFPEILVFNLKDCKLHKKFGTRGEGPQEFLRFTRAFFHPSKDKLITICSQKKMSTFTIDGKYIGEVTGNMIRFRTHFRPVGDNYVVIETLQGQDGGKRIFLRSLEMYNSKMEKTKRLSYWLSARQPGQGDPTDYDWFGGEYTIYDNKIYLLKRREGEIEVFDFKGEKLQTINYDGYEKLPVTDKDKDAFWEYFKTDPRHRNFIDRIRQEIKFPEYYANARRFFVADKKIYVLTHKKKDGQTQLIVFDQKGKFIEKLWLPVKDQNAQETYPTVITGGKLYQLVENLETETWELHTHNIK